VIGSGLDRFFRLDSADDTTAIATALAPTLCAGDVILLEGELGSGKTHFARALIQARLADVGRFEEVPSPSFTLIQIYSDGNTEIWHVDLYRLSKPCDVAELGLESAFDDTVCLVEWPDRLGGLAPEDALRLRLEMTAVPGERLAWLKAPYGKWVSRFRVAGLETPGG